MAKKLTKVKKNGITYQFSAEGIEQGILDAQAAAAAAQAAFVGAERVVATTQKLIGGYLIPVFDSTVSYTKYQLVYHEGNVFRCIQDRAPGPWGTPTENSFVQTSYYNEIMDMRGLGGYETISFNLSVNSGAGVVAGQKIYVTYADGVTPAVTLTADSSGHATLTHLKGKVYSVSCEALSGYANPRVVTHTSNMNERVIDLKYRILNTGIFVVDNNGEETDIESWDVANNYNAKFIKFTDSDLAQGNGAFCLEIVPRTYYTNQKWCLENVQFYSIPNLSSAQAQQDYDGRSNTDNILTEAVGKVEAYNQAHPTSPTTVSAYVQAAYICNNKVITVAGQDVHGFLPSAAQLLKAKNNLTALNNALIKVGGVALPAIGSGNWWSSSQYNGYTAWLLGGGQLLYTNKNNPFQVLPFFDF